MSGHRSSRRSGSGQILAVFVIAMVAIIGIVGLAIDGGGAYAQRRDQQTASDLAALAAANDYLLSNNSSQATDRARTVAGTNNFVNGTGSTAVGVNIDTANGVEVQVTIHSPHRNSFLGAIGMSSWDVTTSATALAGFPDTAGGAGPFIFSIGAFNNDGTPKYQSSTDFGEGNGDVPISDRDMAWTNYGTGNVNSSEVSDIISGAEVVTKTLSYGEYIGQHNNGNHSTLYGDVDTHLVNKEMPVAIVDASGNFMGWATFHVNSADQSGKHINGYFLSSFASAQTTVSSCGNNACPRYLGTYVLKLTN